MRILSQDGIGTIDLPYEQVGIGVNAHDNKEIISYPIISLHEDDYWVMARYSTEEKAKMAIEMLNGAYASHILCKIMTERQRALFIAGTSEKEQERFFGVFKFPSDDELEG